MGFDFSKIANSLSEEKAMQILQSVDEEQIQKMSRVLVEEFVAPALIEVRENAKGYKAKGEDRHHVRQQYNNMPEEKQDQRYHKAIAEVAATAELLRQDPKRGAEQVKQILRNPWYHEALLLAFNDERVPDDWSEERKEFVTYTGRRTLMALIPEAYTEAERDDLVREMYGDDVTVDDLVGGQGGQ